MGALEPAVPEASSGLRSQLWSGAFGLSQTFLEMDGLLQINLVPRGLPAVPGFLKDTPIGLGVRVSTNPRDWDSPSLSLA